MPTVDPNEQPPTRTEPHQTTPPTRAPVGEHKHPRPPPPTRAPSRAPLHETAASPVPNRTGGASTWLSSSGLLCPGWGSNPHPFRERILSPPRLPIPPPGQGGRGGLRLPSPDTDRLSAGVGAGPSHRAGCAEGECCCFACASCGWTFSVGGEEQFGLASTVGEYTPVDFRLHDVLSV